MVVHPPASLRPYAVGMCGFSAAFVSAIVCGLGGVLFFGDPPPAPIGAAALVCWLTAATVLAAGLSQLTLILYRGPQARRPGGEKVVESGDRLLASTFLLTSSAFLGMSLTMIDRHLAGAANISGWAVTTLAAITGLLGLVLASGFFVSVGNRLLRGPSRFELEHSPLHPGDTLRGRLEVPFAAEPALELCIDLELGRSQPGPSPDDPPEQTVVFRAKAHTVASVPVAANRSLAPVEIALDFASPGDLGDPNVVYFWHIEVRPRNAAVWWNAVFEPSIELA